MWYIHSDKTIVTIAIYYIILRTIPLAIITMIEGSSVKFLTIQERWRFESITTSWVVFLTQTQVDQINGHLRSPLVQLRSTFRGFDQRRTIRDNQLPGRSGPTYPRAHVWLPAHPYYHPKCALLQNG